ncbi:MerR family transcriptional regulator [Pseudonocardia sp. HH130630-07]|uniref:MerR family transcriptional regulator n=1 Tax=Pseudonocardia sp. HH130630-07 TaxID=1690815 RepID=UPI0009F6B305|nr:MerR family transcriptional regulator [Pseudonocardia sp. HH130630-07]
MSAPATPDEELLTVDQLAERTGVSVRTIRFYAGRGLIRAPRLRGRTGLYDAGHRARLELVSELTALGFTLAAIEKLLARVPLDAGPEELALHRALLTPWVPEHPEEIGYAELDQRAGRHLTAEDLSTLENLGALTRRAGTVRVHGEISLATALDALDSGLPPELWQRAQATIERHTAALAEDLMALFQDEVLQPYRDRGHPATERGQLAAALSRLKPITVQGVVATFGRAVNRTIRQRVDDSTDDGTASTDRADGGTGSGTDGGTGRATG